MELPTGAVYDAGKWDLRISEGMGADTYINPSGGVSLFYPEKFKSASISLEFLKMRFQPYGQKKLRFIEDLSIIDVMMFNSSAETCRSWMTMRCLH